MPQTKIPSRAARLGSLATALGLLAVLTPAGAAAAAPPTTRTVGQAAVNTKAHSVVAATGRTKGQGVLDAAQFSTTRARVDNRATAVTRDCRDCRAVAVAFQVVLLNGPSVDLRATNLAEAQNSRCERCETLSVAYQFVLATNHGVTLNRDELARLAQLEEELEILSTFSPQQAPLAALADAVDSRALEVAMILQTAHDRTEPATAPVAAAGLRRLTGPRPATATPAVGVHRHAQVARR